VPTSVHSKRLSLGPSAIQNFLSRAFSSDLIWSPSGWRVPLPFHSVMSVVLKVKCSFPFLCFPFAEFRSLKLQVFERRWCWPGCSTGRKYWIHNYVDRSSWYAHIFTMHCCFWLPLIRARRIFSSESSRVDCLEGMFSDFRIS